MSHVVALELEILDLDALRKAAAMIGLEFRDNQETYRWWGRSVGDYSLPKGFTAAELGKCEHAIGIPGDVELGDCDTAAQLIGSRGTGKQRPYEIGVVTRRDGKPGYSLLWDFFNGGYGLEERVGRDCQKLTDAYGAQVAIKELEAQGYATSIGYNEFGELEVNATPQFATATF